MLMPYFPLLKFFMPFSPILIFPLVSSKLRSPDTVCADQCCFLFPICKVEPPHPCLPSFHQDLQNAAFHSPAFLPGVALASHLSCLNANGLRTGNCLYNSQSVLKLYQPSSTSCHTKMPLSLVWLLYLPPSHGDCWALTHI